MGHDNALWVDMAVDSTSLSVTLWLRKRVKSDQYFLIAACVNGHVMKQELPGTEALALFLQLPDRAPFDRCFPAKVKAAENTK